MAAAAAAEWEGPAIGIDLGTTNSCVAIWRNDRVEVIPNELDKRTTPSCVAFTGRERLIGEVALNQAAVNPTNTIPDIKSLTGRRFTEISDRANLTMFPFKIIEGPNGKALCMVQYKGKEKTLAPELISSMVLIKMKETVEAYLGAKVITAVITVPSYFNDSQRQATKDAAIIAGLKNIRLISDSTAAAITYGFDRMAGFLGMKNVLMFDLGSGTLDVSIIMIKDGIFEVRATAGETHLGGNDFDKRMVDCFIQEFMAMHHVDISSNPKAMRKLRTACEKAKRTLFTNGQAYIEIDSLRAGNDFQSTITRKKFEELNMDYFETCIRLVEKCITDAQMEKCNIHEIILIGGATRVPKLQRMLQDLFEGKDLCKRINPDEAIACGAAILAAALIGTPNDALKKLKLTEVNPFTIRVDSGGHSTNILVPRNTGIPTKETKLTVTRKSQTLKLWESESTKVEKYLLGKFSLSGLSFDRKGDALLSIYIDANGIVRVEAGNGNNSFPLRNHMRLSEKAIEEMTLEAEKFKLEDEQYKKMAVARNALEDYLNELPELITEGERNLSLLPPDKEKIKQVIARETESLEQCDYSSAEASEFEGKMEKLKKLLQPIIITNAKMPAIDRTKWQEYIQFGVPFIDEAKWREYTQPSSPHHHPHWGQLICDFFCSVAKFLTGEK